MDPANFNRSIRRLLRSTDGIIQASARDVDPISAAERAALIIAYEQHVSDLIKEVKPQEIGADLARKNEAYASAWLEAYTDTQVFQELELILRAVGERASVIALCRSDSPERRNAFDVVEYGGRTACTLLMYACLNISTLQHIRGSAPHVQRIHALAARVLAPITKASFMSAVCNAARGMVAVAARMRSAVGVAECFGSMSNVRGVSAQSNGQAGFLALTVCQYLRTIVESQFYHLASPSIRSEALQVYGALADSQLLAAAAVILVDNPPAGNVATMSDNERDNICSSTVDASESAATALLYILEVQRELVARGNRQGKRLAAAILRAVRHKAVQRLQVALLDQLAAHAGLAAGLEEWEGRSGPQEGRCEERQAEECGWEGSSGRWWLAREEAAQGKLLGVDRHCCGGSRKAGKKAGSKDAWRLEDYHCHIMRVTVQDWLCADPGEAAAAGVPAAPPPLLVARLAARAAEALCRLCRGQGLEGAYAPAPEWQFATTKQLVLSMLPAKTGTTVGTCAPYWLEAAGWLTALLSDATAAAMGRLPSTKRPDTPPSMLSKLAEHSPADLLDQVSLYLMHLAFKHSGSPSTSIQVTTSADVRRRMSRCGLVASFDHTLRLTYSAQDAGDTQVAMYLGRTRMTWSWVLDARLVSLIPPTDGPDCGQQAQGGGSTAGGCRGEGEVQLGVLFTLSKRAAMLTRALEAEAGAGAAGVGQRAQEQGGQQRRRQILDWAADVLAVLVAAAHSIEGNVREMMEAAGREGAAVSGAGGSSGAVWKEDAVCLDEVQEALALAARAASNLAAPLAWELATDIGTAATKAAVRGRPVQWSSAQELGPHAVCELLGCTQQWWRHPLLPPAQLMACQPHRLLAAACALAAALPDLQVSNSQQLEASRKRVCVLVPDLLAIMSAHETLSGRVRGWLAPPPAAGSSRASGGGGGGSSGSGAEPEACAGCLEASVRSVAMRALKDAPHVAGPALALLQIAASQGGGTEGRAGADGGFQRYAAAVKDYMLEDFRSPRRGSVADVPLPDWSTLPDMLMEEVGDMCDLPPPPPPAAPSGTLPPPLALPPCRQGALPRLRMCGNPHCGNFAADCEGALPLKQCGGCRAVRYCGADCQRAHWRAGHKAECKLMVAEAGN